MSAFLLTDRNVLLNKKNEVCTSFLARTINSFLKLLPNTIKSINISGLKNIFKTTTLITTIFDALINFPKVAANKTALQTITQITSEFIKMFIRTKVSHAIFGNLLDTQYQSLIGIIIYSLVKFIYIPQDSNSPEMDFIRDASEEIAEAILK